MYKLIVCFALLLINCGGIDPEVKENTTGINENNITHHSQTLNKCTAICRYKFTNCFNVCELGEPYRPGACLDVCSRGEDICREECDE